MNHSVRACVKNTAKTAIVSLMIMLTACSTISGNNTNASSDKKMVCSLSAAIICENANNNSDNFNAEILANNKDSNGNNSGIILRTQDCRLYCIRSCYSILYRTFDLRSQCQLSSTLLNEALKSSI